MAYIPFPQFPTQDIRVVRREEYSVSEHTTASGMKQRTLRSPTPTLSWEVKVKGLRSNASMTGSWGTLSEPDVLRWMWNFHSGSFGRFLWPDNMTATTYTASFGDAGLSIQQETSGLYSAAFRIEQRK